MNLLCRCLMLGVLVVAAACTPDPSAPRELHIGTASLGGAFYPVGQTASNLVTRHADGLTMLPVVSAGAIQNPRLVDAGEIDLGITNGNFAWLAANADAPYETALSIQAVGALHASVLHMVTLAGSDIERFEDLRGKRVAVGPAGGGTWGYLTRLLDVHGMEPADLTPSFVSYTDGFAQLGDGNVDAALALAGYPTAAVSQALATKELAFIELADDKQAALLERYPYYTTQQVPAGTYRQPDDITMPAVSNLLIVNSKTDADVVFAVTAAIYGHLDEFREQNAIARQIDPARSLHLPIPLHAGAARFFAPDLTE